MAKRSSRLPIAFELNVRRDSAKRAKQDRHLDPLIGVMEQLGKGTNIKSLNEQLQSINISDNETPITMDNEAEKEITRILDNSDDCFSV